MEQLKVRLHLVEQWNLSDTHDRLNQLRDEVNTSFASFRRVETELDVQMLTYRHDLPSKLQLSDLHPLRPERTIQQSEVSDHVSKRLSISLLV